MKWDTADDGTLIGGFAILGDQDDVMFPIWADITVIPANGGRARFFQSDETSVYFPSVIEYSCHQNGATWTLIVDSEAVEFVQFKGCKVNFRYEYMDVSETDSLTYCGCDGGMPLFNDDFENLVYVSYGEGEYAQKTEAIRNDEIPLPFNERLKKNKNFPSAPQQPTADTQVKVYNLSGAKVYDAQVDGSSSKLQSTSLAEGIYIVETVKPDGTVTNEKVTLKR